MSEHEHEWIMDTSAEFVECYCGASWDLAHAIADCEKAEAQLTAERERSARLREALLELAEIHIFVPYNSPSCVCDICSNHGEIGYEADLEHLSRCPLTALAADEAGDAV